MKLLLDEMFPFEIAAQLRRRGHDVVAVQERPPSRGKKDPGLFASAQLEGCVVVTENRDDFLRLDREYRRRNADHHGIIITGPRFARRGSAWIGRLVVALDRFLREAEEHPLEPSFVRWLQ